ncbi:MAG: T9SS type A sorting domain-containing protein, partial [Chitinophagales bacterium]
MVTCNTPTSLSTINISVTKATLQWDAVPRAIAYKVRYKIAGTSDWTNIQSIDNDKTLKGLSASTEYVWQVKSICSTLPIVSSEWSEKQFFTTGSLRSGALEEVSFPIKVDVYPNPFISSATISFSLEQDSKVRIELYDVAGRKLQTLFDENVALGDYSLPLEEVGGALSAGIYFIKVLEPFAKL